MKRSYLFIIVICIIYSCQQNNGGKKIDKNEIVSLKQDSLIFENDTISIYKIDSIDFFKTKNQVKINNDTLFYIDNFEEAKEILKGRVVFGGYNSDTNLIDSTINDQMIFMINFANKNKIFANEEEYFWDMAFSRYYPSEEILLCEGGHSSDFSFDLKNGIIGPELVGNPKYIRYSPSKKYRLNGWFPGQECSIYFIQKQTKSAYKPYTFIPIDLTKEQFDLCTIIDIFWKTDTELFFRNTYFYDGKDKRLGFFKLKIKREF
ncbi:hypothetical protein [Empedobacter sedimenti]|uniref:hypothetical protein n=1 Tax=Empedobacter sedimenti TaxID=3042610 RepID=UPI0024A6B6AE|nr:hypothetical protein [Empedobacter sedimenti]